MNFCQIGVENSKAVQVVEEDVSVHNFDVSAAEKTAVVEDQDLEGQEVFVMMMTLKLMLHKDFLLLNIQMKDL